MQGGELLASYENFLTLEKRIADDDPEELRMAVILHLLRTEVYHCLPQDLDETDWETALLDYQMWLVRKKHEAEPPPGSKTSGAKKGATFG